MTTFVDTSAIYPVVDREDEGHHLAARAWEQLLDSGEALISTNYVLLESSTLIQRRLGIQALREFNEAVVPVLRVHWVDEALHRDANEALLAAGRRRLSLVDCTSFLLMRRLGIDTAFALDRHFAEQGFRCLPPPETGAE